MPNKNVLATLCAVLGIGLAGLAVYLKGDPLPVLGATAALLGATAWGVVKPARRNSLLMMILAAGSGALFFHFDNFAGLVVAGLIFIWAGFGLLPTMDSGWRLRAGFVAATFFGSAIALWPTLNTMSSGKIPIPSYVSERLPFALAPGLDLRGGMRLVYTVEVEEAIRDKRDHLADDMRQQLATLFQVHSGEGRVSREELAKLEDKVHVATPENSLIRLQFKDKADTNKLDDRFRKSFLNELAESPGPKEGEITYKLRAEDESRIREQAVNQAKETISRRVDALGLREASVTTRDEDIIVEVPGSDERSFDEIKSTIRETARLEFKLVDDPGTEKVFGAVSRTDETLDSEGISIYTEGSPDGLDANGHKKQVKGFYARMSCQPKKYPNESMRDCLGRFRAWAKTLNAPDDHEIGFEAVTDPIEGTDPLEFKQVGWRTVYLYSRAELTGDAITDASVESDQNNFGQPYVSLSFSPAGADRFEEITGANVNRRFAIILDDVVDSTPVILYKIAGGSARITMGAGDREKQLHDARQLEINLHSGALPAPITPSNESIIGPSLGADSIHEAVRGAFYGSVAVIAFMILYYRRSGVVADIAVLFNLMLQMAVLAAAGATMTLPGIAGLALTLGTSIDANVLINERIREELREGKSVRAAVDAGYTRAFPSIIDGHATLFISGLILSQYGTGPVKGFAITLIVGVLCSVFTGVFCTRVAFDYWVRGAKAKRLSIGAEF
jgi:preprotein translocase subunit SecD